MHRREGNDLFRAARAISSEDGVAQAAQSVHKYQAAIEKYSAGISLAPRNHLLWSNRATCFAALGNWARCQEDSLRVTLLRPDYAKGWVLLVRSLCIQGSLDDARKHIAVALHHAPGHQELSKLRSQIDPELTPEVPSDEGSSAELSAASRQDFTRGRPSSASTRRSAGGTSVPSLFGSTLSSLFGSTRHSAGCTSVPLLSPSTSPASMFSPASTPSSSARSNTPMPPTIQRPAKPSPGNPFAGSPFASPGNSRATTPTMRPSSAPCARPRCAQQRNVATWRCQSRGRTSPAPVETTEPQASTVPGPKVESEEPNESDEGRGRQGRRKSFTLSSLAASSGLGVRPRTRPVSAGSCRSHSASVTSSLKAWS